MFIRDIVIGLLATIFTIGDTEGERNLCVTPSWDTNNVLISSDRLARRKDMTLRDFYCCIPEDINSTGNIRPILATEARYVPPQEDAKGKRRPQTGGWLLTGAQPAELPSWNRTDVLEPIAPGRYFLYTTKVTFDFVTRRRK